MTNLNDLGVVIGTGTGTQVEIAQAVSELGFNNIFLVDIPFPRELFVNQGNSFQYYSNLHIKLPPIGGRIRLAANSIYVSDVYKESSGEHNEKTYQTKIVVPLLRDMANFYPGIPSYVFPSGGNHGEIFDEHIDLFFLPLETYGLMLVDKFNKKTGVLASIYSNNSSRRFIEDLAKEASAQLIWYDGASDPDVWWPLNSLVLPGSNGRETVLIDENADSLARLLSSQSVRYQSVPVQTENNPFLEYGKINCATNMFSFSQAKKMFGSVDAFFQAVGLTNANLHAYGRF